MSQENSKPTSIEKPQLNLEQKIRLDQLWSFFIVITFSFWIVRYFKDTLPLHPDCGNLLYGARLLSHGKVPFIDFLEINPPLTSIILIPAYWLFAWFSLPSNTSMFLYLLSYAVISVSWSICILKRFLAPDEWFEIGPMLAAMVLGVAFYSMWQMGQREQLFFFLFLPYFMIRWWRMRGGRPKTGEAVLAGFLGGIGCLIKPIHILTAIAIEVGFSFSRGRYRNLRQPEILGFGLAAAACLVYFLTLPQKALTYFLFVHIPFIFKYYRSHDAPLLDVVFMHSDRAGLILGTCIGIVSICFRKSHPLIVPLLFMLGSTYAAQLIQMKGWGYHSIPFDWTAAMLCGLVSANLLKKLVWNTEPRDHRRNEVDSSTRLYRIHFASVLAGTMVLILASMYIIKIPRLKLPESPVKTFLLSETKKGDSVLVYGVGHFYRYPAFLDADREMGTRYSDMYPWVFSRWAIRKARSASELSEAYRVDREVSLELLTDVRKRKPRFILIEVAAATNPTEQGFIRIADNFKIEILVGYEYVKTIKVSELVDLEVYRRINESRPLR